MLPALQKHFSPANELVNSQTAVLQANSGGYKFITQSNTKFLGAHKV